MYVGALDDWTDLLTDVVKGGTQIYAAKRQLDIQKAAQQAQQQAALDAKARSDAAAVLQARSMSSFLPQSFSTVPGWLLPVGIAAGLGLLTLHLVLNRKR